MHLDLGLERALEDVELVVGTGTRDAGRMCVMSLVACLAGEAHTDSPTCASPLIRSFVIPINDNMPHSMRQQLKLFAPRILGTQDGQDALRAVLLHRALTEEILPRLNGRPAHASRRRATSLDWLWSLFRLRPVQHETEWMISRAVALSDGTNRDRVIAAAGGIGRLLASAARESKDPKKGEQLWALAMDLLDRLCDVGQKPARATPNAILAARVEHALARRDALPRSV